MRMDAKQMARFYRLGWLGYVRTIHGQAGKGEAIGSYRWVRIGFHRWVWSRFIGWIQSSKLGRALRACIPFCSINGNGKAS